MLHLQNIKKATNFPLNHLKFNISVPDDFCWSSVKGIQIFRGQNKSCVAIMTGEDEKRGGL